MVVMRHDLSSCVRGMSVLLEDMVVYRWGFWQERRVGGLGGKIKDSNTKMLGTMTLLMEKMNIFFSNT
jgi:hypothetical protein